jgi:hypothetical protein
MIFQTRIAAAVAGQHGAGVGAVDQHGRPAGDVGQQHHPADAGRADDAADQAVFVDDGIADPHALGGAGVDQAGVDEGAAGVGDGARRDHGHRRFGPQAQHGLIAGVDVLQGDGLVAPRLQLCDLGLQTAVFGHGEEIALHPVGQGPGPAHRRGENAADRPQHGVEARPHRGVVVVIAHGAPIADDQEQGCDQGEDDHDRGGPRQRHLDVLERSVAKRHGSLSGKGSESTGRHPLIPQPIAKYGPVGNRAKRRSGGDLRPRWPPSPPVSPQPPQRAESSTPFIQRGCSSTRPQPMATHDSGSSATETGRPV